MVRTARALQYNFKTDFVLKQGTPLRATEENYFLKEPNKSEFCCYQRHKPSFN